jgi:phospholipid/cholesterol/gamma-HCH transport system substrate-binding protein
MEKNANYALVGLSTLILTMAAIVFIVWLARLNVTHNNALYDIVFEGPVRGLNEGGEVHFNGIKVGEVAKIALDKTNPATSSPGCASARTCRSASTPWARSSRRASPA